MEFRRVFRTYIFFYLILAVTAGSLRAQEIVLDAALTEITINSCLSFYDSLSTVPFSELAEDSRESRFTQQTLAPVKLVKPGNTYWLKFRLFNADSRDKEFVLSFDYWSYVDIYYKDTAQNTFQSKKTGILLPFRSRDYPKGNNNYILLPIKPNQVIDCFVRLNVKYIKSDLPPETLHFMVYERTYLDRYESWVRQYISLFMGIFMVMFLFNLFVYISTRDLNYLYYLVIVLMFMFLTADLSGYNVSILQFIPSFPFYKDYFNIVCITTISIFSILFIRRFLLVPQRYPFWEKVFKGLLALILVDAFILWYDFRTGTDIANLVSLLFITVLGIVIVKSVKDRYPTAGYLLAALIFSILGSFISIFAQLAWIPKNDFNLKFAMPLGNCLEMVLFSFALGYRINLLKKENEQKQLKIIEQLKENEILQNRTTAELENKVIERTNEIKIQKDIIEAEKEKSENLLLNILPKFTTEELKLTGKATPRYYESATVMFTDFVLFTEIASKMSPAELVEDLDYCFSCFDDIINKYGLEKIKTIGDAYMCAGGIPVPNTTHALDTVKAGLEIQQFVQSWKFRKLEKNQTPYELRVGIHTGPLTAGVVGKKKFAFDIWGSTVNLASRLEAGGAADRVNISGTTYELVKSVFKCQYRGKIPIKNKGEMDMYFVETPETP
ncbi:MAG: adenylate/guanylate cyclase domain-containing protein [Saprospiraceae bacterium]|nr:adenylate/guanylate cyclase domain-containing protein [Saprospiraceae bacterium]